MKKAKFKAVLFDFDGTIVDSSKGIYNGLRYAFTAHQMPIPSEEILKKFIGPPLIDSFREFIGLDDALSYKMIESYREYYNETGWKEVTVYAGVEDVFKALKASGVRMGTASTKPTIFVKRILEEVGLAQYFDYFGGTELEGVPSTKTQIIERGLDVLNAGKDEALMVGDRKFDIIGAKEAGIPVAAVLYGFGDRAEFEAHGADYIAESPQALEEIIF